MAARRQLKLGMFVRPAGHHIAAWRHPEAQADAGVNFAHWAEVARTAERGLFDLLFSADAVTVLRHELEILPRMSYVAWIEPFSLMTALATATTHIGLVCTATTTYDEPYALARRFASLDLISGGRAGWNLVTSANASEAQNFGRDTHMEKSERYRRAREFADVVRGLWDSWEDDAFVRDRERARFFDPDKLHILNHQGRYFKVAGPLNVARSPQGQPVLVQAGASDDGRQLAAETAEVVFTLHQTIDTARAFYKDVKGRMAKAGRDPDTCKIMPGLFASVGRTREEGRARFEELQALVHPDVGLSMLRKALGDEILEHDIDAPVPHIELPPGAGSRGHQFLALAREQSLTIRQLYLTLTGGRGHYQIAGSATDVADMMQEWIETGAADGFNYLPPVLPGSLDDFVGLVIPELQRRGIFRTQYEGVTLREKLGLPRPANRFRASG